MKITKKRTVEEIYEVIEELQEQYDTIFWEKIEDNMFIYRPLKRSELKALENATDKNVFEKEEIICTCCTLYPDDFDFSDCDAGIPTILNKSILRDSFCDSVESRINVINYYRQEMYEFDNQITCLINEAFPQFDIEEIEEWDIAKTSKYLSRAEWKLVNLRGANIDFSMAEQQILENSKKQEQEPREGKEKMTKEKLEEIKSQYPEANIKKTASKEQIDSLNTTIDTTPFPLRNLGQK